MSFYRNSELYLLLDKIQPDDFGMALQIPNERLAEFLPYFEKHKYFRNQLEAIPTHHIGKGYTDDLANPNTILFNWGNLWFLAGKFDSPKLKEILGKIPEKQFIFVSNAKWVPILKNNWRYFAYFPRTLLSEKSLTLERIRKFLKPLPEGFRLAKIDLKTASNLEYFQNYPGGPERFIKEAIGFCVKEGAKLVCRATAFSIEKYEIDIFTLQEYRERGFATVACAKLIEYCLERNIKPHWDAANERSAKFALKLGYTDPESYKCYYWRNNPWTLAEIKESFGYEYEKIIGEMENFKSNLHTLLASGERKEAGELIFSSCTKIKRKFEAILSDIERFIESRIIHRHDESSIKEFADNCRKRIEELQHFEELKEEEIP
ncbi:MAG: GNAT family N-acetyltransferase [Candidatus Hodarchaeota archaeon]